MAKAVIMPKAGITVESCIIGKFMKNVGDTVNVGDVRLIDNITLKK